MLAKNVDVLNITRFRYLSGMRGVNYLCVGEVKPVKQSLLDMSVDVCFRLFN